MKKNSGWLNRTVFFIGLVSLFTDMATELAVPLLPAFLASLGGGAMLLGWIEGGADAVSSLLKLYAGRKSDATGRRKPWVLSGYFLSSLARPFLALATAPWHVLVVRITDRTGKGLRSSPRDAMIADSVPEKNRGMAFSFHQGMDHVGAVLGPLIAAGLLYFLLHDNIRPILWLAAVPGALAVLTVWLGLSDAKKKPKPPVAQAWEAPTPRLLELLLPLGLFTLGNASDLFLLKKAGQELPLYGLCLLWAALHVVKASSSLPGGWLSDRLGPKWTISLGWLVYAAIYAGFAFAQDSLQVIALFVAYGLYFGLTEGAEKAWISTLVPAAKRGAAFGWYYVTVGILALPASLIFGWLWDSQGSQAAFLTGAGFAFLGWLVLWAETIAGLFRKKVVN
jgi:MFS family permease